jgi:hypothetical protein
MVVRYYQLYLTSKESLADLSPSEMLASLAQAEWSQQLIQTLARYFLWIKSNVSPDKQMSKL